MTYGHAQLAYPLMEGRNAAQSCRSHRIAMVGAIKRRKARTFRLPFHFPILKGQPKRTLDGGRTIIRIEDLGQRLLRKTTNQRGSEFGRRFIAKS